MMWPDIDASSRDKKTSYRHRGNGARSCNKAPAPNGGASPGAWAVETFEAKKCLREDRFSTIRRPMVIPWAKKRRKYGPRRRFCSPEDFCGPRSYKDRKSTR